MTKHLSTFAQRLEQAWPVSTWRDFTVLVAVSGGADSVALLRGLAEIESVESEKAGDRRGQLIVGHVNHGLRGGDSDTDADFVKAIAESLRLKSEVVNGKLDEATDSQKGRGLEANLRQTRYAALTKIAEQHGARYIVTAHNRNDQVETILFRVMRGTGLDGLVGVPKRRVLSEHLTVVRPMLDISRKTVVEYLQSIDQLWREDTSNQSPQFTRNRIRHQVLPQLNDVFENEVSDSLLSLSCLASEHSAFLKRTIAPILKHCFQISENRIEVDVSSANELDEYLLTVALRHAWLKAGFETKDMTAMKWSALTQLCSTGEPQVENFPGNLRVERTLTPNSTVVSQQNGSK